MRTRKKGTEIQWLDRAKRAIAAGRLGAVIQCGGRGRRVAARQPKPLLIFPNGDRPLSNVIGDLPDTIQIYLHLLREEVPKYMEFLARNAGFGHKVSFLVQQEDRLLQRQGSRLVPARYPDGTEVTASNGSATFIRHFVKAPEFLALIDGAKVGIAPQDLAAGLAVLMRNKPLEAVVFTRALQPAEIKRELRNRRESHTRYARLNAEKQRVYEHPGPMPSHVVRSPRWVALAGVYLVRSRAYERKTRRLRGELKESESADTLFEGVAYHLKLAMTLRGYNGRRSGLSFTCFTPKWYVPGIKTHLDIRHYPKWVKKGVFAYRDEPDYHCGAPAQR